MFGENIKLTINALIKMITSVLSGVLSIATIWLPDNNKLGESVNKAIKFLQDFKIK